MTVRSNFFVSLYRRVLDSLPFHAVVVSDVLFCNKDVYVNYLCSFLWLWPWLSVSLVDIWHIWFPSFWWLVVSLYFVDGLTPHSNTQSTIRFSFLISLLLFSQIVPAPSLSVDGTSFSAFFVHFLLFLYISSSVDNRLSHCPSPAFPPAPPPPPSLTFSKLRPLCSQWATLTTISTSQVSLDYVVKYNFSQLEGIASWWVSMSPSVVKRFSSFDGMIDN